MDKIEHDEKDRSRSAALDATGENGNGNELLNASGHVQELSRNFNLVSLAGVGLVTGNVWPAIGGSILVAIYNGGPPGVYVSWDEDSN